MEITITVPRKVNAKILSVSAGVRHWEDSVINGVNDKEGNLTPCRKSDCWCPEIDIYSGKILNWEIGKVASIHFKICDSGIYTVYDENNIELLERDGYVPEIMCPKDSGYGDYIIMDIDKDGQIQNWKPNLDDFQEDD